MPSSILRAGVAVALALAPVVAVSEPAEAAQPSPVSVADVAPRHFGDGGPAVEGLGRAGASAQLPDGTKVFWDQGAFSIRRVQGEGGGSPLAGAGLEPGPAQTCRIDTGADARQVPLAQISGLWGDVAGNLYAWPGYQQRCGGYGDVYRLDATDHRWHVVVANGETQSGFGPSGGYQSVAVSPDGSVYVSDAFHHVVRRLAGDGSDASGRGVIVAGTLDSPGSGGDGGPATAAQVNRPVLAATGTALFLSDGPTVRRVGHADGVIETVAGTGEQPPADAPGADDGLGAANARVSARALAVSPDGTTVYVASPALDVRAFS